MAFRPNYRARVYDSWAHAALHARYWADQTGRKYRVSRFREGRWIVRPTRKRAIVPRIGFMVNLGTGTVTPLT
jgi:hypothetical protein